MGSAILPSMPFFAQVSSLMVFVGILPSDLGGSSSSGSIPRSKASNSAVRRTFLVPCPLERVEANVRHLTPLVGPQQPSWRGCGIYYIRRAGNVAASNVCQVHALIAGVLNVDMHCMLSLIHISEPTRPRLI
eukprot:5309816-Amphidinium_carterae.1